MRIKRIVTIVLYFITAACFISGCSEKQPVHPNVGLRVYMNGVEATSCGFFMPGSLKGPPGVQVKLTPKNFKFSSGNHEVVVQWEPDLDGTKDHYNLVITVDKEITKRRIFFDGQPIVLIEQPFRVVIENVQFGIIKAIPTMP